MPGKLAAIFGLTTAYMIAEAIGGWLTGSLALLADAGHMAVDALAIGLALLAAQLAKRPATPEKTYGYFRFETLSAFINAATLMIIALSIFYESVERLVRSVAVDGAGMTLIAFGGLLVNLLSVKILHGHHDHDLNSRGAWLHLLGDTLGSVGAIAAGVFISLTGRAEADALVSLVIGAFIILSSWSLIKKAAHVLLEGAPAHLSYDTVKKLILETEGVEAIHDLHLWQIGTGREALSCHVVHQSSIAPANLLASLHEALVKQFGLRHLTLQLEPLVEAENFERFCGRAAHGCFESGR